MKLSHTIQGLLFDLQANGYSPSTARLYKLYLNNLCEYLGDPEIGAVTPENLQHYMMYLRTIYVPNRPSGDTKPLSPAALDNHWNAMRSFFGWAYQVLHIPRPDLNLEQPEYKHPVIIPITQKEVQALLKACEYTIEASTDSRKPFRMKRPTADRDKALILILLVRVGEITRLTIQDMPIKR